MDTDVHARGLRIRAAGHRRHGGTGFARKVKRLRQRAGPAAAKPQGCVRGSPTTAASGGREDRARRQVRSRANIAARRYAGRVCGGLGPSDRRRGQAGAASPRWPGREAGTAYCGTALRGIALGWTTARKYPDFLARGREGRGGGRHAPDRKTDRGPAAAGRRTARCMPPAPNSMPTAARARRSTGRPKTLACALMKQIGAGSVKVGNVDPVEDPVPQADGK